MKKAAIKQQLPLHEQNRLFAAMPESSKERLRFLAEPVLLTRDEILIDANSSLEYVYFPIDAVIALVFVTSSGSSTEVAVVGNEGLVGALNLLTGKSTCTKAYVISSGFAYQLPKHSVKNEFHSNEEVMLLFLRYIQILITQTSITAACNRYHSIEQQYCKLLLLLLDRLPCNNLMLTQELVSNLLGVRREGISEAAVKLQALGIIEYHRGHITILDRNKLEQLSCDCYKYLARETDCLIPAVTLNLPLSSTYAARPNILIDPKCVYCFKFGSCIYLKQNIIQATKKCITLASA